MISLVFLHTKKPGSRLPGSQNIGRISSFEFYITFYDTCKVLHEFLDYKHKYLFLLRFHFYSVLRNFFLLTYHFACVFDVLLNLGYAFTIYKEILHTYTIDNFSVNLVLLTILLFTFFYFPLSRNPSNDLSSSFLVSIIQHITNFFESDYLWLFQIFIFVTF